MLSNILFRRVTNSVYKIRIAYNTLIQNTKYKNSVSYKSFHSSPKYVPEEENIRKSEKLNKKFDKLYVNTNVQNNVILYKHENIKDFIILKLVFFMWCFCNVILILCYYNSEFLPSWKKYSFREFMKVHGINFTLFLYGSIIGPIAGVILYRINHKFVKYIILHKGGQNISIVTNHLFKNLHTITVPVNKVKTNIAREKMINYLPLKVQGYYIPYYIDAAGTFVNKELFDYTVARDKGW